MTMGHMWFGNDKELYRYADDGSLRPTRVARDIICSRCLEPNRITHRALSEDAGVLVMDMPVCFNCALEAWKYSRGPIGRIKLEVVE